MLSVADKIAFLKDTELFSGITEDALEGIAEVTQEMQFSDGEFVFQDQEKGDAVYFVISGEVKVQRQEVELVRIGEGGCVGEMGVIDEAPRCGSVSSVGDSLLLRLSRDDFYPAAQGDANLLQNVLRIVLRKLRRDTDKQIAAIRERERVMQDLVRARELQMNMLPTEDLCVESEDDMKFLASGCCYPAENVGGDYYDYFCLPDDKIGIIIGDVEGHGFHTGLMVAMAKSCLQMQLKTDCSIPAVMSAMGDMVNGFMHTEKPLFMTLCYMIVDLKDRTISYCNAGHTYPYLYRAQQDRLDMLESDAMPLGMAEYLGVPDLQEYNVTRWKWEEGDILVMYTDGITEAQNRDEEEFGEERLKRLIVENAHLSPAEISQVVLGEFNSFCQNMVQSDDITLVTVAMG